MSDILDERLDDGKADLARQAIPGILAFVVAQPKIELAGRE